MGDRRFDAIYASVAKAPDRLAAMRALSDADIVASIAGASRAKDPLLANILATEALNRLERATAIARHVADGIIATDAEFRVSFLNPAATALGIDAASLGRPVHDVLHAGTFACAGAEGSCPLQSRLEQHAPASFSFEATVTPAVGSPFPAWLSVSTVPSGGREGRIILIRDVTEAVRRAKVQDARIRLMEGATQRSLEEIARRQVVEAKLLASETRLARIVDSVSEGIALFNRAGEISFWNKAAETITGRSEREMLGRRFDAPSRYTDPDRVGPIHAALRDILENGTPMRAVDLPFLTPQGEPRVLRVIAGPIQGVPGEDGILASFTDITARVKAEDALQANTAALEARVRTRTRDLFALNRELESFAYTVSHDLKAPARSVEFLSRSLLEDAKDLGADAHDQVTRLVAESRRMRELIDDLLKLSTLSKGGLSRGGVDVTSMARDILSNLQARDPARRVTTAVEEGLMAHADADLLRPLLENLLANAWKYTDPVADAHVSVGRAEGGPEEDVIFVRDNGIGFAMADAKRLFQPFQRLEPTRTVEGTGIGLATVRRIVERHGGRVWVDAKPGQGATFYVAIPRAGAAPAAVKP